MRKAVLTLIMVLSFVATAGQSAGDSARHYAFTSEAVDGGFKIATDGVGLRERVDLPAMQTVRWVDPVRLGADAPTDEIPFEYSFTFDSPGGTVIVTLGYEDEAGVRHVAARAKPVQIEAWRPYGVEDPIGLTYGVASGSLMTQAPIPGGSKVFVALQTSETHQLVTDDSELLVQPDGSTASLPLPELGAFALLGLGLLALVGVARVRARSL